jgi:hypothetical protein
MLTEYVHLYEKVFFLPFQDFEGRERNDSAKLGARRHRAITKSKSTDFGWEGAGEMAAMPVLEHRFVHLNACDLIGQPGCLLRS